MCRQTELVVATPPSKEVSQEQSDSPITTSSQKSSAAAAAAVLDCLAKLRNLLWPVSPWLLVASIPFLPTWVYLNRGFTVWSHWLALVQTITQSEYLIRFQIVSGIGICMGWYAALLHDYAKYGRVCDALYKNMPPNLKTRMLDASTGDLIYTTESTQVMALSHILDLMAHPGMLYYFWRLHTSSRGGGGGSLEKDVFAWDIVALAFCWSRFYSLFHNGYHHGELGIFYYGHAIYFLDTLDAWTAAYGAEIAGYSVIVAWKLWMRIGQSSWMSQSSNASTNVPSEEASTSQYQKTPSKTDLAKVATSTVTVPTNFSKNGNEQLVIKGSTPLVTVPIRNGLDVPIATSLSLSTTASIANDHQSKEFWTASAQNTRLSAAADTLAVASQIPLSVVSAVPSELVEPTTQCNDQQQQLQQLVSDLDANVLIVHPTADDNSMDCEVVTDSPHRKRPREEERATEDQSPSKRSQKAMDLSLGDTTERPSLVASTSSVSQSSVDDSSCVH
jgi:hypothetical protein